MIRFVFKHLMEHEPGFNNISKGFIAVVHINGWSYGVWLGYREPIWWKPRFIGRGKAHYGAGFGWLFLCFRVQILIKRR